MNGPPTSVDDLFAQAAPCARAIAGADFCYLRSIQIVDGLKEAGSYWPSTETIRIRRKDVVKLESLFTGAVDQDPETIDAIATLYHEHIHALGPIDRCGFGFNRANGNDGNQSFSDGLTELWVELTLGDFLDETGIRSIGYLIDPGTFVPQYRPEMKAVRQVGRILTELASLESEREAIRRMVCEVPDTRGAMVAGLIVPRQGVGSHESQDRKRGELRQTFDSLFDGLDFYNGTDPGTKAGTRLRSAAVGS